jgi:hypothetical protein
MILPLQSRQRYGLWGFHHLEMPAQGSLCLFKDAAANKDVIGIEGGDRQDADAGFGKRVQDGGKNAYGGKLQLPFDGKSSPSSLALYSLGYVDRRADDGKLIGSAGEPTPGAGAKDSAMRESPRQAVSQYGQFPV